MTRPDSQVPLPAKADAVNLADWGEGTLLAEGRKKLSTSVLRQRLRDGLHIQDDDLEVRLGLLFNEVSRRAKLAAPNYPFRVANVGLQLDAEVDRIPYEFMLWASISPSFRKTKEQEGDYADLDLLFDKLVQVAAAAYFGEDASSVRFSWPSPEGRPKSFVDAVPWLAREMNLPVGEAKARSAVKDGGVDVAAWRPFRDGRTGFAVLLCQCTVQLRWTGKGKDIIPDKWRGWLSLGKDPVTGLAVPFVAPTALAQWDEIRRTVHIPLDRLRLCELLDVAKIPHLAEMESWSTSQRDTLAAPSSAAGAS